MNRTRLRFLWHDRPACRSFRTGVSLHSHTMHSRESLAFLPRHAAKIPILGAEALRQEKRYFRLTGRRLDYSRAYWTPPLPGRQAFDLEQAQIQDHLGLAALVSLTDHDDIEAGSQLQLIDETRGAPISVEWTVPFGPTYFHIGVHNLPPRLARAMMTEMARYTKNPSAPLRAELLEWFHSQSAVLIVLNHPSWDQACIGAAAHREALAELLRTAGAHIHALEINGIRPWPENQATVEWAAGSGHPLVSGGDRHTCEPNAAVNLTNASDFSEFVSELRGGGPSEVLVLDQYRRPMTDRILRVICEAVGDYPELPGRSHWTERILYVTDSGETVRLSELWKKVPLVARCFISAVRLTQCQSVQKALHLWPVRRPVPITTISSIT